jgi:CheY-like chemotaxis protein/signal transduction histidine kinase/HAMP domain-containing protein
MGLTDLRIGTRLAALAGFLLVALCGVGAGGWYALSESTARSAQAMARADAFEAAVDTARTAQVDFKKQVQEWKDILLRGQERAAFDKYTQAFARQGAATRDQLLQLKRLMSELGIATAPVDDALATHEELGGRYRAALQHYDPLVPASAHLVDRLVKGMDRGPTDKIDAIVATVRAQSNRSLESAAHEASARYRDACMLLAAIVALAVLLGGAVTAWLGHSIVTPLGTAVRIAQQVAAGKLDMPPSVDSRDETGQLLGALKDMSAALRLARETEQARDWLRGGQNELNTVMRGEQQSAILAERVLAYLAERTGASVGAFFLFDEQACELSFAAGYAIARDADHGIRIGLGEGLIGQAVREGKIICASAVPADYLPVSSAFGKAEPASIVVIPLLHGANRVGAIELGAFKRFGAAELELLELAREGIAIGFEVSLSRQRTEALLAENEQQTEELRVQQEELQQSNEELEERAEMLECQREQIRAKSAEAEAASLEIWRKAEQLQKVSAYKSEFLANMSHELRTPLNSMLILSGLLKENKNGALSAKQVEYASTINGAGRDLLELINDILDLSKVEAGQVAFHYEDVAPAQLLASMDGLFHQAALQKGLLFATELGAGTPAALRLDITRTEQILKNLIANAIKFTRAGQVVLHTGLADPANNPLPVPALAWSVRDTGIGVAEDKRELIFEAFKQADGGISRNYGGTGLGLSISLQLARKMGGTLSLASTLGQGSTFTLYLPLGAQAAQVAPALPVVPARPPAAAALPDDRAALGAHDKSILIIDDDPAFAAILIDCVRERGFGALVAQDGDSGLALARHYVPSAVLLDVMLPTVDGWSVMRSLKDDALTRHIPVHFLSCLEERKRAMDMGAIGFVTKPVGPEQLDKVFGAIAASLAKSLKKLLIVEDNQTEANSLIALLAEREIAISVASGGQQAIALLACEHFDCLVLDLGLADMSGFDVLAHIQKLEQARQIPVIIHSGRELTRAQESELHRYAESIIVKGTHSPERLLNEVTLFLHMVESRLGPEKRRMLRAAVDNEAVLENKTMLIVDDDMRNIFSLASLLSEQGVTVLEAENGKEALAQLAAHPEIDLILMDIMMPEMDGYEAMRRIRAGEQERAVPIIAMTAKVMLGDQQKCLAAGASDYIGKPIDNDKLMSLLRVWSGA